MNLRTFQSRTGLEVRLESTETDCYLASVALDDGGSIGCVANTESEALKELADSIYSRNREIIIKNQDYRCARCGRIAALEVHHKIYRSKGRVDTIDNLIAICRPCHEKEHN